MLIPTSTSASPGAESPSLARLALVGLLAMASACSNEFVTRASPAPPENSTLSASGGGTSFVVNVSNDTTSQNETPLAVNPTNPHLGNYTVLVTVNETNLNAINPPDAKHIFTTNRVISMFPTHQQQQARLTFAAVLRGVVSQRLLPRADGKGMVPALEIMVNTDRIREMIEDPIRTREIKDAIAEGAHPYGMTSFDQSLAQLVKQRLVTYEEAVKHSTSPSDFALLFRGVSGSAERAWTPSSSDTGAPTNDEFEIENFEK